MTTPPTFTTLKIIVDERIAILEFARPNNLNALSRQCLSELVTASTWLGQQSEVRVVIIRGQGRAFCAGFDLNDFATADPNISLHASADLGRLATEALTNIPQVTIAAVHGHCVGGGVVLAGACDLRVASDDARFSIPEVDLGIPLAWGGIPRLVREIGPTATRELVLTCRPFDASLNLYKQGLLERLDGPGRLPMDDFPASAKLAWQTQDLNPTGAVGNAAAATADRGQRLVQAAARSLAQLLTEIDQLPADTLRPDIAT